MCGLAGVLAPNELFVNTSETLKKMGSSISHRGPDDDGIYLSGSGRFGLVHRRLAIVDLSAAGHQPMQSKDQRFVIAYNGEIYNHTEIREELDKISSIVWQGHSDTETLLAAICQWGLEATLKRCVGMFALALWDKEQQILTLARDRAGEKPLYYGYSNGVFLFGSELKALKAHPAFDSCINILALALMLRHKYIPAPHTIYQHFFKLEPGSILTLQADSLVKGWTIKSYWSFNDAFIQAKQNPFSGSEQEAADTVETQLKLAVSQQMLADVSVGAFLSGGTDSSLIASMMQAQSAQPIQTFTVGFDVAEYNEAEHAKAVARHLNTQHTEVYVTEQDALNVIPDLSSIYDEPFGDSSQIPTYLIAREAKKHVTVALSGDAGDELFAGYTRYFRASYFAAKVQAVPQGIFSALSHCRSLFNADIWQHCDSVLGMKESGGVSNCLQRLVELSQFGHFSGIYRHMVSDLKNPALFLPDVQEPDIFTNTGKLNIAEQFNWMMLADSKSYLPDDVLVKVDRAAMAVSLETRVPMLDHHFIELALRIPLNMKVNNTDGKLLLKKILYKYVPQYLLDRPKTGFGVPLEHWLRGPLKDWAEALLDEHKLKQQGLFNVKQVRKYWFEHLSGKRNWQYLLWNLLMFQSWLEQQ